MVDKAQITGECAECGLSLPPTVTGPCPSCGGVERKINVIAQDTINVVVNERVSWTKTREYFENQTSIALFRDAGAGNGSAPGRTVAFRVGGAGFMALLLALPALHLADGNGRIIGAGDVVDHDLAWSLYFCDPDGNRIDRGVVDGHAGSGQGTRSRHLATG